MEFKLPYDDVLAMWRTCMAKAYQPANLFARYEHQMHETRPNRLKRPNSRREWIACLIESLLVGVVRTRVVPVENQTILSLAK